MKKERKVCPLCGSEIIICKSYRQIVKQTVGSAEVQESEKNLEAMSASCVNQKCTAEWSFYYNEAEIDEEGRFIDCKYQ